MQLEKRTKEIKLRLTEAEYEALMQKKDGALASWVRQVALGEEIRAKVKPPNIDPNLLRQLAAIGNNLNQIARNINSGAWGANDSLKIIHRLVSIEQSLEALRRQNVSQVF